MNQKLKCLIATGQSVAFTGYNGAPALTTTAPAGTYNFKFTGGIDTPSDTSSLVSLVEGNQTLPTAGALGSVETGMAALANDLSQKFGEQFLVFNASVPATYLSDRVKGTSIYTTLMSLVSAAKARAADYGFDLIVMGILECSGETDFYGGSSYKSQLVQYQVDVETDIKAVTGQSESIPVFCSQPDSFVGGSTDVSQGMIDATRDAPGKVFCISPKYELTYADGVHLNNLGYKNMGLIYARAIAQAVYAKYPWASFRPTYDTANAKYSAKITAATIILDLDVPNPPIILDTTTVTDPGTSGGLYGFEWYDNSVSPATISSVTLIGPKKVKIVLDKTPGGTTKQLRYAHSGSGSVAGPTTGPRGCIRDSSYNWLLRFNIDVIVVSS